MNDYNRIVQLTIKYRGIIIHQMSHLEKALDTYIATYLTGGDQTKIGEMQLLIFGDNRITLESKRQIFQYIAEHHDNHWYNSYKPVRTSIASKKKSNPFNKDLVWVIEQRNIFAHCIPDTSNEAYLKQDSVGFIKFIDKAEVFHFTYENFMELENTILALTRYFMHKNGVHDY